VVVLDLGLPDIDGIKVLEELRGFSKTPVLVVSARHDPEVITSAMGLGAQDYILKPYNIHTLLSSLKFVSRDSSYFKTGERQTKISANLTISSGCRSIIRNGIEIDLVDEERMVLKYLLDKQGNIVTVRELAAILSERTFTGEAAVQLIVNRLRKKLGDDIYAPELIVFEYECGYRFVNNVSSVC
jgi:DNA-binding response OmpR family regulator